MNLFRLVQFQHHPLPISTIHFQEFHFDRRLEAFELLLSSFFPTNVRMERNNNMMKILPGKLRNQNAFALKQILRHQCTQKISECILVHLCMTFSFAILELSFSLFHFPLKDLLWATAPLDTWLNTW